MEGTPPVCHWPSFGSGGDRHVCTILLLRETHNKKYCLTKIFYIAKYTKNKVYKVYSILVYYIFSLNFFMPQFYNPPEKAGKKPEIK